MKKTQQYGNLFRDGQNQIIRILKEFEMSCDEAIIRREGKRLILEPAKRKDLLSVMGESEPLDDDSPDVENTLLPLHDFRL